MSGVAPVSFIQAEDGIRDLTVTGVQTCALPIYPRAPPGPSPGAAGARVRERPGRARDLGIRRGLRVRDHGPLGQDVPGRAAPEPGAQDPDRKSTRLNSSHSQISYAVFCLKKKDF